jgi:hypothetical protein
MALIEAMASGLLCVAYDCPNQEQIMMKTDSLFRMEMKMIL